MSVNDLITQVLHNPETIEFEQVMQTISLYYRYQPIQFTNGDITNEAGTNEGSCKIFYFAQLNKLNENETLALFGQYYRHDVLLHPKNSDHSNIRNFMQHGWHGIEFKGIALTKINVQES